MKVAELLRPTGAVPDGRTGRIVAGSLAAGLLAGLLLVTGPFVPAQESAVTGALLCGFAVVVWVAVHARHRLLHPVLAVLVLASIGGGYETVAEAADAAAYPMPGQLIDVGGHRLHLNCTGTRGPTVVLEPGGGAMSSNLGWITPAVARDTRVCVYDRAGRGWSEPAAAPQDGAQIAADLHTLLHRANVPGPYVLAGHSFGGLYALTFADRYPDEVAGMVLVDSTAPAAAPSTAQGSSDGVDRLAALASIAARLGLVRVAGQLFDDGLPPREAGEVRAGTATAAGFRSAIDEYVHASASAQQAAALRDFAAKPLVVLTAGVGHDAAWSAAQNHLAGLSTNSAHHVVEGATHEALVADQEHAATTTRAILQVVAAVRCAGPVTG